MNDSADYPLYLFAKVPEPGQVKTRMQPELTAGQCAALAEMMLEDSMAKVAAAWPGRRVLSVLPSPDHPLVTGLAKRYGFSLQPQQGADLGERMANVLSAGMASSGGAVVLGCDVPHLPPSLLVTSYQSMIQGHSVIGPARDGGFYLLGLCGRDDTLPFRMFQDVVWGGSGVYTAVMNNAFAERIEIKALDVLGDIDNYADLTELVGEMEGYRQFIVADG